MVHFPFFNIYFQEGSYQAQSNLKFLNVLKDPCHELSEAHPKDIGAMLPKILNLIRMIWVNSEFYNTRERLTGLLRKVYNLFIVISAKRMGMLHISPSFLSLSSLAFIHTKYM